MTGPTRILLLLALSWLATIALAEPVRVLTVQGAIGPATSDYVVRELAHAAKAGSPLVVIELDTPGGLDTSMREIVQAILASPVPVATYVFPAGARAASAGTYILYASHIAAMAPATNLGAATPVAIGIGGGLPGAEEAPVTGQDKKPAPADTLARKQVHDAAAYIRGLAELRGRDIDWAERAVRESVSLSASQALTTKAIDLIAVDVEDLLDQADGRVVTMSAGATRVIQSRDQTTIKIEPDWRSRLLAIVGDPGIAYILMLLGIYGLIFEFSNPGFGVPGVIGAILLLLAMFALHLLPVSYAGLGLILLGIGFMVAEVFAPSFGVLGLGGMIAFVVGSVMLIDTDVPGYGLPWTLILSFAASTAMFMFFVAGMALRARRRPVVTGNEALAGAGGTLLEDCDGAGWARIQGETWRVRCREPLNKGRLIRVVAKSGLTLEVEALDDKGD